MVSVRTESDLSTNRLHSGTKQLGTKRPWVGADTVGSSQFERSCVKAHQRFVLDDCFCITERRFYLFKGVDMCQLVELMGESTE